METRPSMCYMRNKETAKHSNIFRPRSSDRRQFQTLLGIAFDRTGCRLRAQHHQNHFILPHTKSLEICHDNWTKNLGDRKVMIQKNVRLDLAILHLAKISFWKKHTRNLSNLIPKSSLQLSQSSGRKTKGLPISLRNSSSKGNCALNFRANISPGCGRPSGFVKARFTGMNLGDMKRLSWTLSISNLERKGTISTTRWLALWAKVTYFVGWDLDQFKWLFQIDLFSWYTR